MTLKDWIPKYIQQTIDKRAGQKISAQEYSAILNLLIAQGDYNSEWLEYLSTTGVLEMLGELSQDDIEALITGIAEGYLVELANSVTSKTSADLNEPIFSFLDVSTSVSVINTFRPLLDTLEIKGAMNVIPAYVGSNAAYPTVQQLQIAQLAGHAIIGRGYSGITLTEANIKQQCEQSISWFNTNNLSGGKDTIVYPNGLESSALQQEVRKYFKHAMNPILESSVVEPYSADLMNLPMVKVSEYEVEELKSMIADAILYNKMCVFAVDSSSAEYDEALIETLVGEIAETNKALILPLDEALNKLATTINMRLKLIEEELEKINIRIGEGTGSLTEYIDEVADELRQNFQNGCDAIMAAVTAKGSTPASNSVSDIVAAINALTDTRDATMNTASVLLTGYTAYAKNVKYTGSMVNRGAVTAALNAGGSYTVPLGYHNGSGKITANTLASQTSATAIANNLTSGKTAWVNGVRITGTGVDNTTNYNNGYNAGVIAADNRPNAGSVNWNAGYNAGRQSVKSAIYTVTLSGAQVDASKSFTYTLPKTNIIGVGIYRVALGQVYSWQENFNAWVNYTGLLANNSGNTLILTLPPNATGRWGGTTVEVKYFYYE